MIQKAYKYRCYPTKGQQEILSSWFGSVRWVYNWGLKKKSETYITEKRNLTYLDLAKDLTDLKKVEETKWLKEAVAQSLQQSLRHLDNAYTQFFKKNAKFPKFKSRKNSRQSISFPQDVKLSFKKNKTYFPKKLEIYTVFNRRFEGKLKTVTLSKDGSEYYISFLVEVNQDFPNKPIITDENTVGLDLGIKTYAVLSNGTSFENHKNLNKSEKKLKRLQRKLSKKVKGSKNYQEIKEKLNKVHKHVANQRNNFIHKLSHQLTNDNQIGAICMEDLDVQGMVKNHKLAKSISDCSWGNFKRLLQYKSEWYGRHLIIIGMFAPSSKLCNCCGYLNQNLKLSDRTWICPRCQEVLDRDLNAAKNIKSFGLMKSRSQGTGSEYKQSLLERWSSGDLKELYGSSVSKNERRKKELNSGKPEQVICKSTDYL